MNKKTNPFMLAVSMLTRIPVKTGGIDDSTWKWTAAFFPLCGYIIGAVCIIPAILIPVANSTAGKHISDYIMLNNYAVNLLAALLFVILNAWMTRLFHLDGFCDSCDAFSVVTDSQEKRLEIIKDPHPGAVAVCTSSLLLLTKTVLVFLILQRCAKAGIKPFLLHAMPALIAIPVFARLAMVFLAFIGKYPRKDGTGKTVIENTTMASVVIGLITISPFFVFISPLAIAGGLLISILTVYYWKQKADKLLGGVTGDILGACCETAECTAALAFLVLMK